MKQYVYFVYLFLLCETGITVMLSVNTSYMNSAELGHIHVCVCRNVQLLLVLLLHVSICMCNVVHDVCCLLYSV